MKKILIFLTMQFILSCSDANDPQINHFDLPLQFPLQVGNAWIYERHFYDQGTDSIQLDTLFTYGMLDEYYKFTWRPGIYYSLVKNQDNKLINYGQVTYNLTYVDTVFFRSPVIWAFFAEDTGFVDLENWTDYQIYANRFHIGIIKDMELFDKLYDTFIETEYDAIDNKVEKLLTVDGYAEWRHYRRVTGEIYLKTKLIKKMINFFPLEKISANQKNRFVNKVQNIRNADSNYFSAEGIKNPQIKR